MHEAAAIQGVVSRVLARMNEVGATHVSRITLVLGVSGHLMEDAARQHFALYAEGTPAEHARLDIQWLPATYQCLDCRHIFTSLQPPESVLCPECDGLALEVAHSGECYASEIEVEGGAARDQDQAGATAMVAPSGGRDK